MIIAFYWDHFHRLLGSVI